MLETKEGFRHSYSSSYLINRLSVRSILFTALLTTVVYMTDIIAESFSSVSFTKLSKVHSLHISNFGLLTISRFLFHTLHNIYVFSLTQYMKHERNTYGWNSSNISLNRNTNAKRTERYKHEVKFKVKFRRKFVTYTRYS